MFYHKTFLLHLPFILSIPNSYPNNINKVINEQVLNTKQWLVLGTGLSIIATRSAKHYIENKASVHINIQEPFNYCHYKTINMCNDLVLLVIDLLLVLLKKWQQNSVRPSAYHLNVLS